MEIARRGSWFMRVPSKTGENPKVRADFLFGRTLFASFSPKDRSTALANKRRRRLMFGILVSLTVSLLVPQSVVLRPCLRQLAMEPIRADLAFPGSAAEGIVTTNALAYQLEGVESGGFDTLLASAAPFAFGLLALVIFYQGWQIFSKTF